MGEYGTEGIRSREVGSYVRRVLFGGPLVEALWMAGADSRVRCGLGDVMVDLRRGR